MLPIGEASGPEVFRELLEKRAPAFGISLSLSAVEKLSRFLAELDVARRRTNLTGPLTVAELVDHTLESALGERLITHGIRVIDIGSGAGFPGIPLALVRPDLSMTALEPRRRRAEFLRGVAATVPVTNAAVRQARVSDLEPSSFDLATSRAVGDLAQVVGRADFLKPGGALLAWTTHPRELADALAPILTLGRTERVPGSRGKLIALYRKTPVPGP